jgi:hypothetical protein
VAVLATVPAFALLARPEAARLVSRVLALEAYSALFLGGVLLALERVAAKRQADDNGGSQFSVGMGLAAGALFCTVAGHFALLPLVDAARAGQGGLSFGQLHAVSVGFFAVKLVLVAVMAVKASRLSPAPSS